MIELRRQWAWGLFAGAALILGSGQTTEGGGHRARRVARPVPTSARRVVGVEPSPMLGTFYPDRYVNIRGNNEIGGGFSPLGTYGNTAGDLYGPFSAFRATAAPVQIYQAGYNGGFRSEVGTGFSYPNFPTTGPILYPTRANVLAAPRRSSTPLWWDRGTNFIDLD